MRFSIRDLFWLTLVVALGMGWETAAARATEQFPPTVLRENKDGTWKLTGESVGGWKLFNPIEWSNNATFAPV